MRARLIKRAHTLRAVLGLVAAPVENVAVEPVVEPGLRRPHRILCLCNLLTVPPVFRQSRVIRRDTNRSIIHPLFLETKPGYTKTKSKPTSSWSHFSWSLSPHTGQTLRKGLTATKAAPGAERSVGTKGSTHKGCLTQALATLNQPRVELLSLAEQFIW